MTEVSPYLIGLKPSRNERMSIDHPPWLCPTPTLTLTLTLTLPITSFDTERNSVTDVLKLPPHVAYKSWAQTNSAMNWQWHPSHHAGNFEYISSSSQNTIYLDDVCPHLLRPTTNFQHVCASQNTRNSEYVCPLLKTTNFDDVCPYPSQHTTNLDVNAWPSLQHTMYLDVNAWPPVQHITNLDSGCPPSQHTTNLDVCPLRHAINFDVRPCLLNICKEESLDRVHQWLWFLYKEDMFLQEDVILSLLQRCIDASHINCGRQVFLFMISNGLDIISYPGNYLIRLFISCESLKEAVIVFHRMNKPTIHSWHFIISGCVMLGENALAFSMFYEMKQAGIEPNTFIFTSLLKACGKIGDIDHTRMIHNHILRGRIVFDVFMGSALVDAYAECNRLDEANRVFEELHVRNVVCWNTMLGAYVKNGYGASALTLFEEMYLEGLKPDRITFMCAFKACGMIGASKHGVNIHRQAIESGLELNIHVSSALIDMYAKCGDLNEARRNFQKLPSYDVVSWGAIMAGYIQHGDNVCALEMFENMEEDGLKPDIATFSCALKACGSLGALQRGKEIHNQATESGQVDMMMISTIIDMYARCGNVDQAQKVLNAWPHSGIAAWGAMIKGYALNGDFSLAQKTFEHMEELGIKPNEMIYTSIITACSHAAKVEEGQKYFISMRDSHVKPTIEHFGCMVDLLARGGYLYEAEEFLEIMPIPPDGKSWMSLLTGCRKYRNVQLGRRCFDQVVQLDSTTATGYQIMMQIYAHSKMWKCIPEIQELRRCANAWRKPGKAWIEVNNKIHEFVAGDKTHPEHEKIYAFLDGLREPMEEEGYVPETDLVFEPMTIQDKEDALCGHSEKLAVAFGLLSLPSGSTIRVSKNLRMCNDCHSASKVLSRIEKRHIIVSDEYCVHHFKDGLCLNGNCI